MNTVPDIENLKTLAAEGVAEAQYELGNAYAVGEYVAEDFSLALQYYGQAAEQNHSNALCNLAFFYYLGKGVEQDVEKGLALFEQSAELGQSQSQLNLGIHFCKPEFLDISKALHWLKVASANGEADATYNLGMLYFEGLRVGEDHPLAFEYFQKAAELGSIEATYSLGYCYSKGVGVEKDSKQAVDHFKAAANRSHASAQYNLGLHYEYGQGGLNEDHDEAIFWYQKASSLGHERAAEAIQLLERE